MMAVTVDTGHFGDIFPGALVTWMHTPRGGYGYAMPVDAKVLRCTRKLVRIEVTTSAGRKVQRDVKPESLRWRK